MDVRLLLYERLAISLWRLDQLTGVVDQRADRGIALDRFDQIAVVVEIQDEDRHVIFLTQRERGQVHHVEAARQHLIVAEVCEALRGRVLHRVSGVDAVDLGRLDDDVGVDLHRRRARVSVVK